MPDLKLIELDPTPPVDSVVAVAKHILELAEAGHLRSLAVVGGTTDGGVSSTFDLGDDPHAWPNLVTGASVLTHRLMTEME